MFGYRVLGFGSHPSRGVVDSITWATSMDATFFEGKPSQYQYGYDTHDGVQDSAHGSIDDATVDGMVAVGDGTVTILKIIYVHDTIRSNSVRIKLIKTGAEDSTNQTGWESITINGTTYYRSSSSFNQVGTGGYTNEYEHIWYTTSTNPFGTTSSASFDVSMSNLA